MDPHVRALTHFLESPLLSSVKNEIEFLFFARKEGVGSADRVHKMCTMSRRECRNASRSIQDHGISASEGPTQLLSIVREVSLAYDLDIGPSLSEAHTFSTLATREEIIRLVSSPEFFFGMGNSNYGFKLSLAVFQQPPYPSMDPVFVFWLDQDAVSSELWDNNIPHVWDATWELFHSLVFSEPNSQVYSYFNLPKNVDKRSHYAY